VTLLQLVVPMKAFLLLDHRSEPEETTVADFQPPVPLEEAPALVAQGLERHLPFLPIHQVTHLEVPDVKILR
jgi:hypothetical protein